MAAFGLAVGVVAAASAWHPLSPVRCGSWPRSPAAQPPPRAPPPRASIDDPTPLSIPETLRDPVIARLSQLGYGRVKAVAEVTPGPGLTTRHFRYDTEHGPVFCKLSARPDAEAAFEAEAASLRALGTLSLTATEVRVPRPLATGTAALGGAYLLLEWVDFVPFGASIPAVLERLGRGLALMHSAPQPPGLGLGSGSGPGIGSGSGSGHQWFGFPYDTRLGPWRQPNGWRPTLADFFVEQRLKPQLEAAEAAFDGWGTSNEELGTLRRLQLPTIEAARRMLEVLPDRPALLHGDLWMGNCGADADRTAVIFDPACWYGHPEFDLALPTLFGNFGPEFYAAYHEVRPKAPGFEERQRVFVLYHSLNQLNLYGAGWGHGGSTENPRGYYERVCDLMRRIVSDA